MKNFKYIISIILIIVISSITYMYFIKKPVESIPTRATLVLMQKNMIVNEVAL